MKAFSRTLTLLLILTLACRVYASHYLGASITYECLGGAQYKLHYHYYADCQGVAPFQFPTVAGVGTSCSAPTMTAWTLQSSTDATFLSPALVTTCNGGSFPGMRYYHYTAIADFTGATCSQYILRHGECCRSGATTNISNPTMVGGGIYTDTLDLTICNSSPVWHNPVPYIALSNRDNHFDLGGSDPDGDSLSYRFVAPLDQNFASVPYAVGYYPGSPMGSTWNVRFDFETGLLSILPSPGSLQQAAMAVEVEEWRNGQRIGRVHRSFEIMVMPSLPANQLPTLSGPLNLNGAIVIGNEIIVSPGATACMDWTAADLDPGQATQLSWMSDLAGATLTDTFSVGPDTVLDVAPWARLCWTAPLQFGIDTVTITGIDTSRQRNNMVIDRWGFRVGDTRLVWPGDANNDLVADAFDLLPIGIAYGGVGPTRVGASNTWVGQTAFPWQDTITGGLDKKFIDCDGSGQILSPDTIAVSLNYGLTHTKAYLPVARGTSTDPLLTIQLPDSAGVGDTISAPILLGDANVTAANVLGLAFRLNFDATLIDSSTFRIEFNGSWLAPSGNPLTMARNHPSNRLADAAIVRSNHTTVSGMGEVARAHFVIIDNIDGKRAVVDSARLRIDFTDVQVVTLDGGAIQVDAISDSTMVYDGTVDAGHGPVATSLRIWPNPAHGRLELRAEGEAIGAVELLNLQGQVVLAQAGAAERIRLDVSALARGMYLMRTRVGEVWNVTKVVLE